MIVGFVNAGVMNLFQATTMIMGANIGTTITAQIVALQSFDIVAYVAILAFIGIFMNMLGKRIKLKRLVYHWQDWDLYLFHLKLCLVRWKQ